jgi:hypothetical protein
VLVLESGSITPWFAHEFAKVRFPAVLKPLGLKAGKKKRLSIGVTAFERRRMAAARKDLDGDTGSAYPAGKRWHPGNISSKPQT